MRVAFIGGGNMAIALIAGLLRQATEVFYAVAIGRNIET